MFKKITAVSVVSSFILTSPGLDFYQVWAQGKVRPLASGLPTAGFILPNPGSAAGSKWLKGFPDDREWTLAPTIGPMGAVPVPAQPGMSQVQNAADLSLGLSEDLEGGKVSDTQARMESGKIFGLHPVAFKDQFTSITAVLRDLPAENYPRKKTVIFRINHALRDMKKHRLALPPHGPNSMWYPPAGGMMREVPLSPQMGVVLAKIKNLAEQTRQDAFGQPKQRFIELFFSRLSRLEKEMLKPVRRWENRNGIGGPTLMDRLIRQGAKEVRAVKTAPAFGKKDNSRRGFVSAELLILQGLSLVALYPLGLGFVLTAFEVSVPSAFVIGGILGLVGYPVMLEVGGRRLELGVLQVLGILQFSTVLAFVIAGGSFLLAHLLAQVLGKTAAVGAASVILASIGPMGMPQDLAQAQYAKAVELYDEKKYQEAAAEFSKAIELNPNLAKAYLYRAHCLAHRSIGDLDGAVQSLRAAVQAEPNSYEAHYYLSIVLYRKGQLANDAKLLEESRQEEQKAQEISEKTFR